MLRTLANFLHRFTPRIEKEVELRTLHATFVGQSASHITNAPTTLGTSGVACCEMGVGTQQNGIICRSSSKLSDSLAENGSVVARQRIVGFLFQDDIKIAERTIVISDKRTQQSAIVVRDKVFGNQFYHTIVV